MQFGFVLSPSKAPRILKRMLGPSSFSRFLLGMTACFLGGNLVHTEAYAEEAKGSETPVPVKADAKKVKPYGLMPADVTKLNWTARSLCFADVNQDGKQDALLINNEKSRVEILIQRDPGEALDVVAALDQDRWEPVLEDARFEKKPFSVGDYLVDLAVADLDGDKRVDLITATDEDEINVYFQNEKKGWGSPVRVKVGSVNENARVLYVVNLDASEGPELLVQSDSELIRLSCQGRQLKEIERIHLSRRPYGISEVDLNHDGRNDLLLQVGDEQFALRALLQTKAGSFGAEELIEFRRPASLITLLESGIGSQENVTFASIASKNGALETFEFSPRSTVVKPVKGKGNAKPARKAETAKTAKIAKAAPSEKSGKLLSFRSDCVTVPVKDQDQSVCFTQGDFNGDGKTDLAASDPSGAQVFMYLQLDSGRLGMPAAFPSLSGISSMTSGDTDGDGRDELFVASPSEQQIGHAALNKKGRLPFPASLGATGAPGALVMGDLSSEKQDELVYFTRDDGDRKCIVQRGKKVIHTIDLEGLRSDPSSIQLFDANQDGLKDIALFTEYKPMILLLQKKDGSFEEPDEDASDGKGLFSKMTTAAFSLADIDGDGKLEMLAAKEGLARAVRLGKDGAIEVREQYNASEPSLRPDAVRFVELSDAFEGPELLFFDSDNSRLEVHVKGENGLYASHEVHDTPSLDVRDLWITDFDENGQPDVFVFGDTAFWRLDLGAKALQVERTSTYESDLPGVTYLGVEVGDLNHDKTPELVVLDAQKTKVLEVLRVHEDGWKSAMHFRVFDVDPHFRGRKSSNAEPREFYLEDLTGDGKQDLVLLIHDRFLVYPQE